MKFVIAVPARGGSKRLPGKNILSLAGKPLINHTIDYARKEYPEANVYISTDSLEIMRVVYNEDCFVIERPESLSGDYVSTAEVLKHLSGELYKNHIVYDYMILLQCTNPLRPKNMLREAIADLCHSNRKCLVSVSPLIMKLGRIENENFIPWNYCFGQRSQDISPLYYENGLIYISHFSLIDEGKIINDNPLPFIIDHPYAQVDIDTIDDFKYAESLINMKNEYNR